MIIETTPAKNWEPVRSGATPGTNIVNVVEAFRRTRPIGGRSDDPTSDGQNELLPNIRKRRPRPPDSRRLIALQPDGGPLHASLKYYKGSYKAGSGNALMGVLKRSVLSALVGCRDVVCDRRNVKQETKDWLEAKYGITNPEFGLWWQNSIHRRQLGLSPIRRRQPDPTVPYSTPCVIDLSDDDPPQQSTAVAVEATSTATAVSLDARTDRHTDYLHDLQRKLDREAEDTRIRGNRAAIDERIRVDRAAEDERIRVDRAAREQNLRLGS